MNTIKQNAPHMIMACVAIAAVTVLCIVGKITGGEALAVIGAASGFTMAAGASSASGSAAVGSIPASSVSPGQTLTETVTHQVQAQPSSTTPATVTPLAPVAASAESETGT
jgi:hypothetical protein